MIVQLIESRYTVDHDILKSYLKDLFGKGNFEIIVSLLQVEMFEYSWLKKTATRRRGEMEGTDSTGDVSGMLF